MPSGSSSSAKENAPLPEPPRQLKGVTNAELYEQWAPTYDFDGNVLQALDDTKTRDWIPELVKTVQSNPQGKPLNIVDFGCGTGRSTIKLLKCQWNGSVVINAWDGSLGMLNVAKAKCGTVSRSSSRANSQEEVENQKNTISMDFRLVDFSSPTQLPTAFLGAVDGLISTLVLEHIPLDTYWSCIYTLLKPGGIGLVSNMHPDMGAASVAGFKDEEGKRLIGKSFVHGVEETVEAARKAGLEVWDVEEMGVEGGMVERGEVGERGKKWVGSEKRVWYGMKFRKVS